MLGLLKGFVRKGKRREEKNYSEFIEHVETIGEKSIGLLEFTDKTKYSKPYVLTYMCLYEYEVQYADIEDKTEVKEYYKPSVIIDHTGLKILCNILMSLDRLDEGESLELSKGDNGESYRLEQYNEGNYIIKEYKTDEKVIDLIIIEKDNVTKIGDFIYEVLNKVIN